ncbi:hypothetical protein V6N12_031235 [Hibiscus sabdariffa]|uniref:Uncharacterized protein n=1 Tax=Hibiscus sabdariffa TaxID=183260 RepID=A0ABR2E8T2_9ROSI
MPSRRRFASPPLRWLTRHPRPPSIVSFPSICLVPTTQSLRSAPRVRTSSAPDPRRRRAPIHHVGTSNGFASTLSFSPRFGFHQKEANNTPNRD